MADKLLESKSEDTQIAIYIGKPRKTTFRVGLVNPKEVEKIIVEVSGVSSFKHMLSFPTIEAADAWIELAKRNIAVLLLAVQLGQTGSAETEDPSLTKLMGGY